MAEDKNSSNLLPANNAGSIAMPPSPNVPNAAGKAIVSTPDIDTPAVPAEPGTGQAHPFIANHPTRTFNTGIGDTILNTKSIRPKGNKKPFIIGGIILASIVAICAAVLLLLPKGSDTSNESVSIAETQFNQFATYFLYGKREDKLSGNYESDKSYELDLQLEKATIDEGYWEKSTELLDQAITSASEDQSITRYLIKSLQNYRQNYNFIRAYRQNGDLDEEKLLASYISSGADTANTLIDNFYAKYSGLDSNLAKNYAQQRKVQYGDLLNTFAIYNKLGCIRGGDIDEAGCTGTPSQAMREQFTSLSSLMKQAQKNADSIIQKSVQYLKAYCWKLSAWLQNPVDERDGGGDAE